MLVEMKENNVIARRPLKNLKLDFVDFSDIFLSVLLTEVQVVCQHSQRCTDLNRKEKERVLMCEESIAFLLFTNTKLLQAVHEVRNANARCVLIWDSPF